MPRYYGVLLLPLIIWALVPFVLAAVPTCQQLGLKDVPSQYSFTVTAPVIKNCWITYSGSSYSQMGARPSEDNFGYYRLAPIHSRMTTWSESLVEIKLGTNQEILIQINPWQGGSSSQGDVGGLEGVPVWGLSGMTWPTSSQPVPLGFAYAHTWKAESISGDVHITLEAQIDMTGTNYTIDDAALKINWCGDTSQLTMMGQSWSGHGLLRKYRVAGDGVFVAGGCYPSGRGPLLAMDQYRIPIIRVIGGDGSGAIRATTEAQFGDTAAQDWWFVTLHKLIFIKQKWWDASSTVEYRIDPSVKGPPDAAPSGTLWTGAYTVAMTSGYGIVPTPNWDCNQLTPNTMWALLCNGGYSPINWDNVDNNGAAIRIASFMIPVGSPLDTNWYQGAPAYIDLRGTGFKFQSYPAGFIASHTPASPPPIIIAPGQQFIKESSTRIPGNGDWSWIGTSTDINAVRGGTSPIYLDFQDGTLPACSTWGMQEYSSPTGPYIPDNWDNPNGYQFLKACKLPLSYSARSESRSSGTPFVWDFSAVVVVVYTQIVTNPLPMFGFTYKFMINPMPLWATNQNQNPQAPTLPVGYANSCGGVQANTMIDLRGTQFYVTDAPQLCGTTVQGGPTFAEDGWQKTWSVTGQCGWVSWIGCGTLSGLLSFQGNYRIGIQLARRVGQQQVVSQIKTDSGVSTTVHTAVFLDHYYNAGFQPGSYAINPSIYDHQWDAHGSWWMGQSGTASRTTPVPIGLGSGSGSAIGWSKIILDWTEFKFDSAATGLTWNACGGGTMSWTTQQSRNIEYTCTNAFVFPSSSSTRSDNCNYVGFSSASDGTGYRIPLVFA